MPEEKTETTEQNVNSQPPEKPTTRTPEVVKDDTSKDIRKLQVRLSDSEKKNQDLLGELGDLRKVVEGLVKIPARNPDPSNTKNRC